MIYNEDMKLEEINVVSVMECEIGVDIAVHLAASDCLRQQYDLNELYMILVWFNNSILNILNITKIQF